MTSGSLPALTEVGLGRRAAPNGARCSKESDCRSSLRYRGLSEGPEGRRLPLPQDYVCVCGGSPASLQDTEQKAHGQQSAGEQRPWRGTGLAARPLPRETRGRKGPGRPCCPLHRPRPHRWPVRRPGGPFSRSAVSRVEEVTERPSSTAHSHRATGL